MSISRAQVQFIVRTGLFDDAIRRATQAILGLAPLLQGIRLHSQRHQSRVITRRKQRRSW